MDSIDARAQTKIFFVSKPMLKLPFAFEVNTLQTILLTNYAVVQTIRTTDMSVIIHKATVQTVMAVIWIGCSNTIIASLRCNSSAYSECAT